MRFAEIFKTELFSKYGQKAGCYINEIYDIIGARDNGIRTAAVLYGYGNRKEFEEECADYILDKVEDILQFR